MGYSNIDLPKNSTFLVTGAAGFIGSNLVEALLNMGHKVRGLDNFSTGKEKNIESYICEENFEFINGDIRNFDICMKAVENIDFVLHQAALGSVPRSMEYPLIYEDNNIKGTAHIMEAAKLAGVKRLVFASSSAVYGDSTVLPKVEGNEGALLSPYALTKKVNEEYGRLYTGIFGLECIGLRYFNVFGRRQDPESYYAAVLPKFIKTLLDGDQVTIYGDGEQSRDFTYIDNVIEANLKSCIASKSACGQAYNIAVGERLTVNQMYNLICKEMNISRKAKYINERPGDIKHSLADISMAIQVLGYHPNFSFTKGFQKTFEWYKEALGEK